MIEFRDVSKHYHTTTGVIRALDHVSFQVGQGEWVALCGRSGSGKSTAMHIMGLLDRPTAGQCFVGGEDVTQWTVSQQAQGRNALLGFVFQSFHLLPRVTVMDNVCLPLRYRGVVGEEARRQGERVLEVVGLSRYADQKPQTLSGGQQQRVAIARALVGNPACILADEPTGALDRATANEVMSVLQACHTEWEATIIVVTHDEQVAAACQRMLMLEDGRLVDA